jgi:hypothetical protein
VDWIHHPVMDLHATPDAHLTDMPDVVPLDFVDALASTSTNHAPDSPFTSGVFTVGDSGQVEVEYLWDGGGYKGDLAFFSLEGMDQFEPGSSEFIHEAARRALSESDLGHVVIHDASEGAKFSGKLAWEADFNKGEFKGAHTVQMKAGSQFGVMLVPNGSVKEVFERAELPAYKQPLFSMSTANPDDHMYVGKLGMSQAMGILLRSRIKD